jgi:hypothetical protein
MHAIRLLCVALAALPATAAPAAHSQPLLFTPNCGQAHRDARFVAKGPRLNAYFTERAAVIDLRGAALRIEFAGSAGAREIEADGGSGVANFLLGPEEAWITGVPLLDGIVYRDVYPGIDVRYGGSGADLKSEYVVRPGSDPSLIRLRYEGADRLEVDADGSLAIQVGRHGLHETPPVIYQERGGVRQRVEGGFQVNGDTVSFVVGGYDRSLPLTIDPVLYYLTLLGGSNTDAAMALAVDAAGSAYLAGYTASYDLPVVGAEQSANAGSNEVFVAKLAANGSRIVYCTYIGGRGDDRAYGIAVDAAGAAYVAGSTTSANFPVRGAYQSKLAGGRNAFVLKLAAAGNTLVYSTYLGGNGADIANGVAIDAAGNAYVAGDTTSTSFPATAFQKTIRGAPDGFVAKLSADGSQLVYSTYLGGNGEDHLNAIAVDASGSAVVTGSTYSPDFPVANAFQSNLAGGQDAFVTKLSADGKSLLFSTYLGGSGGMLGASEAAHGIALDTAGNVYVAGETSSVNFPIRSAVQSANTGWQDGFVSKFGPTGALVYSTYVGGVNLDVINAIAVDRNGFAYVAGQTTSATLASILVSQSAPTGVADVFVIKLAATGDSVAGLSYFGGIGADVATALALDSASNLYVAGWTLSPNFAVVNGFQSVNGGNYSAFAGKMSFSANGVAVSVSPLTAAVLPSQSQQFTATVVNASNTAVTWSVTPSVGVISATGLYTAPPSVSAQTVTVTATSVADITKSATASVTLVATVGVTVAPAAVSLGILQTQQFSATVVNTSNTGVTWSVTPAVGSISTTGLYTAPSTFSPQTVLVKATSIADPSKSASAVVTLAAVGVTVAPATVSLGAQQTQQFSATVTNASNTGVTWSVSPSGAGTITAGGLYTAPAAASQQTATVRATSVADGTKSGSATVTVLASIAVHVAPSSATLYPGDSQQFTATVDNTANQTVSWTVTPAGAGSVTTAGLYTAPSSIAGPQTATLTAVSAADATKTASVTISLLPTPALTNLALGKTATESSTSSPASRAVDGNTDGYYFDGSVSHTGLDANAWWQVDLGASYTITTVRLWNRTDCCADRLSDYWVFVSNTPFADTDTPATLQVRAGTWGIHQTSAPQPTATITPMSPGRYIRVQLSGTNNLHLAEVQVYGTGVGVMLSPGLASLGSGGTQQFTASVTNTGNTAVTWSVNPNVGTITSSGLYTAPTPILTAQTVTVTAASVADPSKTATAPVALQLTGGPMNLARGKAATQSSTWGVGAGAAVDGNTDGAYFDGSVSQTNSEPNAWWQVDLGASATIPTIAIWNRTDCCASRLSDYWIFVSDTPFAAADTPTTLQNRAGTWRSHQTSPPDGTLPIAVGAQGRYVRIQLSGTNPLHMAEVQVMGSWASDNLAIGKAASESTTWSPASRAVDGNTDGIYFDNTVSQTGTDPNAWWQVDLGASAGVGAVAIWNRTDCCGSRLADYWIFVSDTPFAVSDTPATLQSRSATWSSHQTSAPNPMSLIPVGAPGRYVRVQLSGTNNLHMAEVQVFGAFH